MSETAGQAPSVSGRLDDRVLDALHRLRGEVAFSGLKRILGAHPESLARALRRLEREGLVLRAASGYRALTVPPATRSARDATLRAVAEVELPPSAASSTLIERLSARWFGSLRWVGVVARPGEELLAWATRSGEGLVLLGVRGRQLRVLVPERFAGEEAAEVEEAAYELLFHAIDALREVGTQGTPLGPLRAYAALPSIPAVDN